MVIQINVDKNCCQESYKTRFGQLTKSKQDKKVITHFTPPLHTNGRASR